MSCSVVEHQIYIVRMVICMSVENTFAKFGFMRYDYETQLKELLKNSVKLKEIYVDAYPENPLNSPTAFTLLLRTSEKNAIISVEKDRLILSKNNSYNTYIMNIPLSKITECFAKISEGYSEYILNVQNIYYKMTVLN